MKAKWTAIIGLAAILSLPALVEAKPSKFSQPHESNPAAARVESPGESSGAARIRRGTRGPRQYSNAHRTVSESRRSPYFSAYQNLSNALYRDDLPGARAAAEQIASKATKRNQSDLVSSATAIAESADLEEARDAFAVLSDRIMPLLEEGDHLYVMECPMMDEGRWIQTDRKVKNPYMGSKMPECGRVIREIKSS